MPKQSPIACELARFVRYDTVCTRSNKLLAFRVGGILKRFGFRVFYQRKKVSGELFVNVIGLKGKGKVPFLMCSHLDTVPPGELSQWTRTKGNPWKARVRNGHVYGLGTADDKGSLVAMLSAARALSKIPLKRPLMLMGTFGEESGMQGALLFRRMWKGSKPCCAFVGEPTSLGITHRHKGLGVIEIELEFPEGSLPKSGVRTKVIEFKGKQGHSSRPHLGDNALDKAMVFLDRKMRENPNFSLHSIDGGFAANLIPDHAVIIFENQPPHLYPCLSGRQALPLEGGEEGVRGKSEVLPSAFNLAYPLLDCYAAVRKLVKRLEKRKDSSFYPSTITSNFGVAKTTANVTKLVFDFRLLPGQSVRKIYTDLKRVLSQQLRSYEGLHWRINIERENPPLGLKRNHSFIRLIEELLRKEAIKPELSVKPSCTEAGIYSSWGVPAIIFGPGKADGNIHAPNESIKILEIEKAAQVYRRAIQKFCVEGKCF